MIRIGNVRLHNSQVKRVPRCERGHSPASQLRQFIGHLVEGNACALRVSSQTQKLDDVGGGSDLRQLWKDPFRTVAVRICVTIGCRVDGNGDVVTEFKSLTRSCLDAHARRHTCQDNLRNAVSLRISSSPVPVNPPHENFVTR